MPKLIFEIDSIKGTAYTLVTEKDKEFVGHIVRNLEAANQEVSKDLMDLV
jgi:ATP-dependent RNA helicase DDX42